MGKKDKTGVSGGQIGKHLPYVEKDPTLFYSPEEFRNGFGILVDFCLRRAESVRRQLDGKLATVNAEQQAQDRVDASDLRIMDMGGPDWITSSEEEFLR